MILFTSCAALVMRGKTVILEKVIHFDEDYDFYRIICTKDMYYVVKKPSG